MSSTPAPVRRVPGGADGLVRRPADHVRGLGGGEARVDPAHQRGRAGDQRRGEARALAVAVAPGGGARGCRSCAGSRPSPRWSTAACGMVEKTPSPQSSPDPAPGAETDTKSFEVEKGAGTPAGSVAATLRPALHPPLAAADRGRRVDDRVAGLARVARRGDHQDVLGRRVVQRRPLGGRERGPAEAQVDDPRPGVDRAHDPRGGVRARDRARRSSPARAARS